MLGNSENSESFRWKFLQYIGHGLLNWTVFLTLFFLLQVDNKEKFSEYCHITNFKQSDCMCAIIIKDFNIVLNNNDMDIGLSSNEQFLMDFYECSLEEFPRPVVQLPRWIKWNEKWKRNFELLNGI